MRMAHRIFSLLSLLIVLVFSTSFSAVSFAQAEETPSSGLPEQLKGVGIEEKLGAQIDLNTEFQDESGKPVKLANYFRSGKPVILSFAYYECPMLCGVVLNALSDGMKGMDWVLGDKFEAVNISIDPKETAELAAQKK